ncbi:MAG: hypothetical protein BV459_06220, partial [Thermoplasmata archaeon M11B2D]
NNPDLLIILSPQYSDDSDIHAAILTYRIAVKTDLGWNSQLISLQEKENTYQHIDTIIETTYQTHPLKACLMVGEDLNTALAGDSDYLEQPSTLPWATLGNITAYETTDQGILCKPSVIHLCISLLYPTHTLLYEQKKSLLLFAFEKFATQRHTIYPKTIHAMESSTLNANSKTLYQQLSAQATLIYTEDATESEILAAYTTPTSACFVHGHSNPAGTDVHRQKNTGWFTADYLNTLQTPFFGADGCYVAGWWSNQTDNNHLDPSIDACWYGSKIFTSASVQVMALGLLSQNGFLEPVSFLENVMPKLLSGTTLAEAMIGTVSIGDTVIVGDPTFHYPLS